MKGTILLVAVVLVLCLSEVNAWGFQGHRITAQVAANYFLPETSAAMQKYLGGQLYEKQGKSYPEVPCLFRTLKRQKRRFLLCLDTLDP